MGDWLWELDRVLRGEATRNEALRAGTVAASARRLAGVSLLLGVTYGFCMGFFGVFGRWTAPRTTTDPYDRSFLGDAESAIEWAFLVPTFPILFPLYRELLVQSVHRLPLHRRQYMGVNVHRHTNFAMP